MCNIETIAYSTNTHPKMGRSMWFCPKMRSISRCKNTWTFLLRGVYNTLQSYGLYNIYFDDDVTIIRAKHVASNNGLPVVRSLNLKQNGSVCLERDL